MFYTQHFVDVYRKLRKDINVLALLRRTNPQMYFLCTSKHIKHIIMYRPSQFQVSGFGVSADVRRITLREFYYFCASTQITLFRISADVRRKTLRDNFHFAHLRTIQCFGISADVRRKTAQDYFHFSAPTQVTIVWRFCGLCR